MGEHKHSKLLEAPDFRRRYDNNAEGSRITADTSLRRLGLFCEFMKVSPGDLLKLDDKQTSDLFMDFVRSFRDAGKAHAGTYIAAMIKPVKSWLAFNGITTTRKIKIAGLNSSPSLKDERVPTQEELKSIFLSGDSGRGLHVP